MVQQPVTPESIYRKFMVVVQPEGVPDMYCPYPVCNEIIKPGDRVMLEMDTGFVYCVECGECRRYERKKAVERQQSKETE